MVQKGDLVTFDEVTDAGKAASYQLPGGALLRYDPSDRSVRLLRYPATPHLKNETVLVATSIPDADWSHHLACTCACCARASSGEVRPPWP